VAGFALVFSMLGYGASYVGRWLSAFLPLFRYIGGFIVVLMGLHLLGLLRWRPLMGERRVLYSPARLTPANAFLLGTTFSIGWSACTGPILASILVLASIQASAWSGVALLGAYSLGIAVPLVLLMVLSRFSSRFRLPAFVPKVSHYVAGVLMVGLGVLMMTGRLAALSSF
jgi:cytochrome c-type biogenesis protein